MTLNNRALSLTLFAGSLSLIGCVLHSVAFGVHAWYVGDGKSPFLSIGYHTACFSKCGFPYCPQNDPPFDDCHGIFYPHIYFEGVYSWIRPDWYMLARAISIATVPMTGVLVILHILDVILAVTLRNDKGTRTRAILFQAASYFLSIFYLVTACLCLTVVCIWYVNSQRVDWMPLPHRNQLGYAFWFVTVCVMLYCGCALLTLLSGIFTALTMHYYREPEVNPSVMYPPY